MPPPNAGIWMTNERYDFLMNRAEIAESRLREAETLLDAFCQDWCEDGYEYADRDRIHGKGFRTSCEKNRCHIWWAHQILKVEALRGAGEEKHPLEATWVCEEEEKK